MRREVIDPVVLDTDVFSFFAKADREHLLCPQWLAAAFAFAFKLLPSSDYG